MRWTARHYRQTTAFNMTAMIDVVFLLIIFFMLLCQFIRQDNDLLAVPDDCSESVAAAIDAPRPLVIQIAAVPQQPDRIRYAFGTSQWTVGIDDPPDASIVTALTDAIVESRKNNPAAAVLTIRADRAMPYRAVLPVMLAAASAGAENIRLAAFTDPQPRSAVNP